MTKFIVVTGASKGIGRAAADALAESGWSVLGVARHTTALDFVRAMLDRYHKRLNPGALWSGGKALTPDRKSALLRRTLNVDRSLHATHSRCGVFLKECVEKTRVNVSLTALTPSREFRIPTFNINRLLEANVGTGVAFRLIDRVLIEPDIEVKETTVTNQSKPYETLSQAQKALKIFMVPKFTSAAYFAATEKGAKQAVAELKGEGMAIDFLYTGPSAANTDEEIRMIDDLDRKSTRLNSSHGYISYAVFCLKKKKKNKQRK